MEASTAQDPATDTAELEELAQEAVQKAREKLANPRAAAHLTLAHASLRRSRRILDAPADLAAASDEELIWAMYDAVDAVDDLRAHADAIVNDFDAALGVFVRRHAADAEQAYYAERNAEIEARKAEA